MIMKKHIIILLSAMLFAGCMEFGPVFNGKYQDPEPAKVYTDEMFVAEFPECRLVSIQDVKDIYNAVGGPVNMSEDIYVKGQITTSDKEGNVYKSFYIQDESAGIEIKVGKTGLYNSYKLGQWVYVRCKGLTVGEYEGAKQIGYEDITGEYESAYLELQVLVDRHVFKGEFDEPVQPLDLSMLPSEGEDALFLKQDGKPDVLNEKYIGKYVTIRGLVYTNQIFCLAYVDPNQNHKLTSNRIFLDEEGTWNVHTWGMSKGQFEKDLKAGKFDKAEIGNGPATVGGNKNKIIPSAYSVSQYFRMASPYANHTMAIRSSGYAKFADTEIPPGVVRKIAKIDVTGILNVYDGEPQFTLIDLDGVKKEDGTNWY